MTAHLRRYHAVVGAAAAGAAAYTGGITAVGCSAEAAAACSCAGAASAAGVACVCSSLASAAGVPSGGVAPAFSFFASDITHLSVWGRTACGSIASAPWPIAGVGRRAVCDYARAMLRAVCARATGP